MTVREMMTALDKMDSDSEILLVDLRTEEMPPPKYTIKRIWDTPRQREQGRVFITRDKRW